MERVPKTAGVQVRDFDKVRKLYLAGGSSGFDGHVVTTPSLEGVKITDLFVEPAARGKGTATSLIDEIKKRNKGQTLTLRARPYGEGKSNLVDLKKFYRKLGFTEESPAEDRFIMKVGALEKSAKRWFWKLMKLPEEQRRKALLKLTGELRANPQKATVEDLLRFGMTGPREGLPAAYQRTGEAAERILSKSKWKNADPRILAAAQKHAKRLTAFEDYGDLRFSRFHDPAEKARKFTAPRKLVPEGAPVTVGELPVSPRHVVYRGATLGEMTKGSKPSFASPHPQVAAGYGPVIAQLRTPKGSVFTHNLGSVDPRERAVVAKAVAKGAEPWRAGSSSTTDRPSYETVLRGFDPRKVLRLLRSIGTKHLDMPEGIFRADKLKNVPLQPVKPVWYRQPYGENLGLRLWDLKEKTASIEDGPDKKMVDWFEKRTKEHIELVKKYCKKLHDYDPKRFPKLVQRGKDHDKSKYGRIEHDPYLYISWRYKCENAGDEFKCPDGMKTKMHEATEHHVNNNRHHPEFFGRDEKVVNKRERHAATQTLVNAYKMKDEDIAELVADWCSVSEELGSSPRTWAKKTIEEGDGQRWLFSEEQKELIYELIDAAWGKTKKKASADFAPGLPDPKRFGDVRELPKAKALKFVIQKHLAQRAGTHYDVRMGTPETGLLSWATKKEWPKPGEKRMLYQQPVHKYEYGDFQGTLPKGYGAGVVKTHDKGAIVVTEAAQDKIKFIVAHRGTPEYYVLLRRSGPPQDPRTERQRVSQGGSWLLINTTPQDASKFTGLDQAAMKKIRYKKIPAEDVEKLFTQGNIIQDKVDGASLLYRLFEDHIEAASYRVGKKGEPIVHTQRMFGLGGAKVKIPKEHVGTVLRGEAYGEREGKAIPPQELGGILNASIINSQEKQKAQNVQMKSMLFDVAGEQDKPYADRLAKLEAISKFLPKKQFHLPQSAKTIDEAKALWDDIRSHKNVRTREGIIAWPSKGPPTKVKLMPERDVWVKKVFPGQKRLKGKGAGGFEYSTAPEGPVKGRVGTGFSESVRRDMIADPERWIGRMARIKAQEQFPSGAYRAPSFLALHEDYPSKAASLIAEVKSRD